MKYLKRTSILLMLLTIVSVSRVVAQDYFARLNPYPQTQNSDRGRAILQDNEYTTTGFEEGIFYDNPLMLNGKPLDFNEFHLGMKGELTVVKGAAVSGNTTQVSFYIMLQGDGYELTIPGSKAADVGQTKIDISEILQHALPGDRIVIQPVNKEDGPAKRILKIPDGC